MDAKNEILFRFLAKDERKVSNHNVRFDGFYSKREILKLKKV